MNELAKEIESIDEAQQKEVLASVMALLLPVVTLLSESAKSTVVSYVDVSGKSQKLKKNTIKNTALSKLMTEIDRLEKQLIKAIYNGTIDGMTKAIEATVESLSDMDGIDNSFTIDADKDLGQKAIVDSITLEQRIQRLSAELSGDVRKYIRQGVFAGEDVDTIVSNVRKAFTDTDWKIARVVESEIYNAYRYQFGETTSKNGYDWIRIHESFPRHPNRKRHRCYALANKDKYGKGQGVYKSTDIEIYYPHPQCTSWLEVVEALD